MGLNVVAQLETVVPFQQAQMLIILIQCQIQHLWLRTTHLMASTISPLKKLVKDIVATMKLISWVVQGIIISNQLIHFGIRIMKENAVIDAWQ